jgi:hypothetical protein
MADSSSRRAVLAAAVVFAAVFSGGCASEPGSAPPRDASGASERPAVATSTTTEDPVDEAPAPDPDVRTWPLPTLPEPYTDHAADADQPTSVAAAWLQLVATRTGDPERDAALVDRARRLSTSDDTLRVQLLAADGQQTVRIVEAKELAPDEAGGVVVAVAADVGQPGDRPTVATVRLRLERNQRGAWLVDEVVS